MARGFSETMSALRREKGLSQRRAAAELHISQALLSHYENGAREPGLGFLCRACEFYGVSSDYLLGRTDIRLPPPDSPELRRLSEELRSVTERIERFTMQ